MAAELQLTIELIEEVLESAGFTSATSGQPGFFVDQSADQPEFRTFEVSWSSGQEDTVDDSTSWYQLEAEEAANAYAKTLQDAGIEAEYVPAGHGDGYCVTITEGEIS